ncbi:DNA polymerase IV [Actinotalea sp. M2MS4P-6]|uniref:DNA polymerase IV n=1 Tax=Actinotalea sp. M2MS4P-6 TaxID=2983762 RepID=UPI0021E4E7C8|nr:DNA polymerase IV [Actinotalea sp. M2MS4P-6]MCV2393433.1 DNA polymerase IV [Actinotalea sp. M2MS4P-6]
MSRSAVPASVRRDWGEDDEGCGILHVDMDAFFASVEVARRPDLRGLPVIVGGDGRSVVLAATYEARAFGVHAAMPMARARRLCPQAVVVPPDRSAYTQTSARVMAVLGDVTAIVEQVSVDEAFLDVSGARRRLGSPTRIAAGIRARVRAELDLACSVGVASTKSVAKLASGMAKPDGLLLVPRGATVELLHSLPVEALWGVGESTRERLARWGILSVAELARTDVAQLQRIVGQALGRHLHDLAWGRDPRPVVPVRQEKSVGAETTFDTDTTDLAFLEARLLELADTCARQLRRRGLQARTVSLKVRTADWQTLTRSRTLGAPTDVAHEIFLAARELLAGVDLAGRAVRLIGVRADQLSSAQVRQPTLDEAVDGPGRRGAEQAMDEVRRRFGPGALGPGTSIGGEVTSSTTAPRRADLS